MQPLPLTSNFYIDSFLQFWYVISTDRCYIFQNIKMIGYDETKEKPLLVISSSGSWLAGRVVQSKRYRSFISRINQQDQLFLIIITWSRHVTTDFIGKAIMPIVTPVITRDICVIPTACMVLILLSELFVFHSTLNIRTSELSLFRNYSVVCSVPSTIIQAAVLPLWILFILWSKNEFNCWT